MSVESWQTAEIAGPTKSLAVTKPEIIVGIMKKSKRRIMIVGEKAAHAEHEGYASIRVAIQIAKVTKIPVTATGSALAAFQDLRFNAHEMSAMEIGSRLIDPNWKGLDGNGQYDLALFLGLPYYMEWLVLNALKHFSDHLKTISLDRYYQPNASWSFPNISVEEWKQSLETISEELGGK